MFCCGKYCSIKVLLITTLALLVLLIGVIVLGFIGFPAIIESELHKTVQLKEDTITWDRFRKLPVDLDVGMYVFHIENVADIANGAYPKVKEVGPYYYTQSLERNISSTDEGEDSVTYEQIRKLKFNAEKSYPLSDSDNVTVINPVMIVLTQTSTPLEILLIYGCIDQLLPENLRDFFITSNIRELMLDGLRFSRASDLNGPSCTAVRNLFIERAQKIKNVDLIYEDDGTTVKELKFSVISFRQSKQDGIYTVNRGIKDVSQLGNLMKWDGKEEFSYWGTQLSVNNDTCNRVRGTDGTIYPPHITTDKKFEVFSSDICRGVTISYNGTKTYKGIEGYIFAIGPDTLKSAFPNPENDCYCTKQTSDQTGTPSCFLDGIMDLMPCFYAPLLLSWPHFLYADEYRNGMEGMSEADPDLHRTFLLIEHNTGTPLQGAKRVQLNFVLRPIQFMPMTANQPRTIVPLVWMEEGFNLNQDLVDELDSKYFGKLRLVKGVKYGLIAICAAIFSISLVFLLRKKYCTKK